MRSRRGRRDAYEAARETASRASSTRRRATRSSSSAARPRRSTSSRRAGAARNVGAGDEIVHHLARASRQHRPVAAARQREAARRCAWPRSTTAARSSSTSTSRLLADRTRDRRVHARVQRAGHDHSRARDDRDCAHATARACWSTARRRSRTCRSTCRRSTATSTSSPGTRCSARPASAPCTAKRDLLDAMPPWQGGGNMIRDVTFEQTDVPAAAGALRGRHRATSRTRSGSARRSTTWSASAARTSPATSTSCSATRPRRCRRSRACADRHRAREGGVLSFVLDGLQPRGRRTAARLRGDRGARRAPLRAADPPPLRARGTVRAVPRAVQHARGRRRCWSRPCIASPASARGNRQCGILVPALPVPGASMRDALPPCVPERGVPERARHAMASRTPARDTSRFILLL